MESQQEKLAGIVERVTFHNVENGWSVLKVSPFGQPNRLVTVVIHQAKVFAGSSMEFWGNWSQHPKHGEQFKADQALEKKPASAAALEKYLGSGLIKGVGPVTASRIVKYFKDRTLSVFEENIDELMDVPGIAERKLADIKESWREHKAIRDVMIFLQGYGISTLYAVKIFKAYGEKAIEIVKTNPYQLARDIYGIGFFSADRIALSMGFERDGDPRIEAGVKHVLAASRDEGHCFLTEDQIVTNTLELLQAGSPEHILLRLLALFALDEIKTREFANETGGFTKVYYAKSLFFDEKSVADKVKHLLLHKRVAEPERLRAWIDRYSASQTIVLSEEQLAAVVGVVQQPFSILTGGPGCGKTTTTKVLVKLLLAMGKKVFLAAPTGRAAQRMTEVIGLEAKTLHRLLEWAPETGGFKKCEADPLSMDVLIVDECSMLDISLAAAVLKAVPNGCQVLFIGDPDQLPSVGAGNVLHDLLQSASVPSFRLHKVFRQAEESLIIKFAHQINKGVVPKVPSPFHEPEHWQNKTGCLFIDAEEVTQEQAKFVMRARKALQRTQELGEEHLVQIGDELNSKVIRFGEDIKIERLLVQEFEDVSEIQKPVLLIPDKFRHVDLAKLHKAQTEIDELKQVLRSIHPWSALRYGKTALDTVLHLYTKTIPEYFGAQTEVQILTPQVRGSLGTMSINAAVQAATNPEVDGKAQLRFGDRVFRVGDRVIQTRNNYDLGVFNGDIGRILSIDGESFECQIVFGKQNPVIYGKEEMGELSLAYGITIHKSQGSEFDAVIIPVATQHFKMLFRNLIYTGLTRSKRLCVFVGSRKALSLAIRQVDSRKRQTALALLVSP